MKRLNLLFAFTTSLLWSQATLPETPAGRRFGEWLEVFNRGQRAEILQFFEKNYPERAAQVDATMSNRKQSGGFDVEKVDESSSTKIAGVLKRRAAAGAVGFALEVEPAEPHRIKSMTMRPGVRPATPGAAIPRMSEADLLVALRAELEQSAAQDRFSGAVLVSKNGKPIFEQAYGLADGDRKIPHKTDTRLRIGSMNKMFTAVAIAQLAQAGKLRFEDPLIKYVPDYPQREVASKVTIHHMLTHTGGTGDVFGPLFAANVQKLNDSKDYVDLYGKRALEFEPGSRWAYSNYGFILLGLVVEKVSGQNYYDYVREHIYKVADMSSTDWYPERSKTPFRATGYINAGGVMRPNTENLPPRGSSAGGGYSTVGDLVRFGEALVAHKLLNAEYTEIVTTGKAEAGPAKYAYGFYDHSASGVHWFGHGGGSPGVNGDLKIYPASGYMVAVLANLDPPAATRISTFIGDRLPAK